ncbi:MAG: RidA family protein [Planctomycetes bacterium]|nr:RidA family protein [Planctomycetota bacterium]
MTHTERLAELGITLPPVPKPVGSYVPALRTGNLVLTSGQLPMRDGALVHTGKVPRDTPLEAAADAASIAALNAVAAAAEAAGGLDSITRVVRVCVFVNSSPGFVEQPKVANGASDLLARIFGDAGRHVRSAVGVAELPLDAAVELELVVEVS